VCPAHCSLLTRSIMRTEAIRSIPDKFAIESLREKPAFKRLFGDLEKTYPRSRSRGCNSVIAGEADAGKAGRVM
jgi:hypothetical protein